MADRMLGGGINWLRGGGVGERGCGGGKTGSLIGTLLLEQGGGMFEQGSQGTQTGGSGQGHGHGGGHTGCEHAGCGHAGSARQTIVGHEGPSNDHLRLRRRDWSAPCKASGALCAMNVNAVSAILLLNF